MRRPAWLCVSLAALLLLSACKERLYEGKTIAQWVEALGSKDSRARRDACLALARAGREAAAAVPTLAKTLEDPEASVREMALEALGDIGPPAAAVASQVASFLPAQGDDPTRVAVLRALGKMGPAAAGAAIPAIERAFPTLSTVARGAALSTLSRFGEGARAALPLLVTALGDPTLQPAVAEVLGLIGPPAAATVPALRKMREEANVEYGVAAAAALYRITGDPAEALPVLERALASPLAKVRMAALEIPTNGPKAEAFVPLVASVLTDARADLRALAASVLGSIGSPAAGATEKLAEALGDRESSVRRVVAVALGRIGPGAKGAVPALRGRLAAGDVLERIAVLRGLHGTTGETALFVPLLVEALTHPLWVVRGQAAEALAAMGPAASKAVPALEAALDDPDPKVREEAGKALERIRPR